MAGVLDAVPYDGTPVIKDGKKLPLMPELSRYHWSEEDVRDTGRELTDEEWAEFFANELGGNVEGLNEAEEENEKGSTSLNEPEEELDSPPPLVDDEVRPGDDVEIKPSGEVEAMLALLELGRPLPPDPREAGKTREDAAAFTARLDKIVARYEAQFLKRREWRITTKEIREMDERWNALAMRSEFPAVMDDITEVVPSPDFPPEVQQQWDRCQWILYRLRRAHIDGPPAQPAQALASAGLVAEDVIFRDALLECKGLPAWLEYAQRVEQTGGFIELANIWGSASEDRPDPQWHIVVDSWLNIPYPHWYMDYFMSHFNPSRNPESFLGAFAAAMGSTDSGTPEYLEQYAAWAEQRWRPPKREKRVPLLSRDPYEGRPLSFLQRLRTGSVPVVEANPSLTIDDADAEGRQLSAAEPPSSAPGSYRAAKFVEDPGRGEAPFARAARDPYSGGRNLLLPLFRRLQQRSMRLLSLVDLVRHGRSDSSTARQEPATAAARTAADASEQSESPSSQSNVHRRKGRWRANPVPAGDAGQAQEPSAAGGSDSGSWQGERRYTVSTAEALDAAGRTVQEWQRERAKLISWRTSALGPTGNHTADPPMPASHSTNAIDKAAPADSAASVVERLKGGWRAVKPGVSLWADPGDLPPQEELLQQLSKAGEQGDAVAQLLASAARSREGFLRSERPRQTAMQENGPPPGERQEQSGKTGEAARPGCAALTPGDEQEAAVVSAAAARVRANRHEAGQIHGVQPGEAEAEQGWSRRSLSSSVGAGGPRLKLLGAADLSGRPGSASIAADGCAAFAAAAAGGAPETHRYRLLLRSPHSDLMQHMRRRRAADSTPSSAGPYTGKDAEVRDGPVEAQEQPQREEAKSGAQGRPVSGSDTAAAAAARLGLRLGGGLSQLSGTQDPVPAVPDLIGLFLGDSAEEADDGCDESSAQAAPSDDAAMSDQAGSEGAADGTERGFKTGGQASGANAGGRKQTGSSKGDEDGEEGERKALLGMAWRDGRYMTIPMTTLYEFNVDTGQVDRITCHWNGIIAHVLGRPEDARDVYVRQTRLHELMYREGFKISYKDMDLVDLPAEEAMDTS